MTEEKTEEGLNLTMAQQAAIFYPVSVRDDMNARHNHRFVDIHGRTVWVTLTISRYESILFGRPVWEAKCSLMRNNMFMRLSNKMMADAYAGAVFALMGVGEDTEYVDIDESRHVFMLRVAVTDVERDWLEDHDRMPDMFPFPRQPQQDRDRPPEHKLRQEWMDNSAGSLFVLQKPKEKSKELPNLKIDP